MLHLPFFSAALLSVTQGMDVPCFPFLNQTLSTSVERYSAGPQTLPAAVGRIFWQDVYVSHAENNWNVFLCTSFACLFSFYIDSSHKHWHEKIMLILQFLFYYHLNRRLTKRSVKSCDKYVKRKILKCK